MHSFENVKENSPYSAENTEATENKNKTRQKESVLYYLQSTYILGINVLTVKGLHTAWQV